LDEDPNPELVQRVLANGYQSNHADFTDGELNKIGRDAFLVAYALADPSRIIVTKEITKRTQRLGNTKLPDACHDCGIQCCEDFRMYQELDFNLSK
jgi:hypothetical protein